MREHIKRVLRVQGWNVYGVREEVGRLVVRVGKSRKGANCLRCGERSLRVRLDETRRLEQQLRHREIKKSPFLWVRKGS